MQEPLAKAATLTQAEEELHLPALDHAVGVIIPASNESSYVANQIRAVSDVMRTRGWLFEIIVVDDGSTDETGPLALADGIRVLRNRRIRRYGASFVRSIAAARYERILIIDADDSSSCS